jgi:hypothetical protein
MAITIARRTVRHLIRSHDDERADQRLAEVGGHDPSNKVLYEGWLYKRAISGTILRNWKKRYIIIRKDRVEYHRGIPLAGQHAGQVPRGLVILDKETSVELAPEVKHSTSAFTIRVHRRSPADDLYLNAPGKAEMDRWLGYLQGVLKGAPPPIVDGAVVQG